MRRHTLDPDSIRKQIKSVFTSPTRKLRSFTNNNNGNSFISFGRRTRRFSVPEKKSSEKVDTNPELHTIHENETNATGGTIDQSDVDRSQSTKKTTNDSSKRARFQAVFSSRTNPNEKKTNTVLTDSVGVFSHTTNNTSGPGDGGGHASNNVSSYDHEQPNVGATLGLHTHAGVPVASLTVPTGKSQLTNINSPSKQSFTRRVRSRSKTDGESVSEKSLFSRLFSGKKSKKPMGTLITTTTKSIDLDINNKGNNLIHKLSLVTNEPRSAVYEEEYDYDDDNVLDESTMSINSVSDANNPTQYSNKKSFKDSSLLPTSDSQYYASLSSAPTGYSISYHRKNTNDLRIQAALGRLQQQQQNKKENANDGGANQLMSLFQDPKRNGTQSPSPMTSGTTRIKTFSGQTIITRNGSSSDRPSTYCIRSSSFSPTHDGDETFVSDDEIYTHFMKCNTCYDIMPKSSKLVIFDTQLPIKKAFFALVYNGVRAAPLWDNKRQKFIGLLTVTDFILMLQKYYKQPHAKIDELEEHRIETWRDVLREYERPLLYVRPNQNLFDAARILLENHVHRLPIIDPVTNNVTFILTHKRILRFFYLYIYDWPQPLFMSKTLEELNVGTYNNLHIIEESTTVIEALGYFVKYRVSALPVVDKNKRLVNIYSKFDIIGLAPDKNYRNLNMTINDALSYRKERFEAVSKCYKHETLATCMERVVKAEVHRLVIVDNDEHVIGILSLSDLLTYIVIRPTKTESLTVPIFTPTTTTELL